MTHANWPDGLEKYAETPVFTDATVPAKLTSVHDTKPGVWGRLVVLTGALDYILAGPPEASTRVRASEFAVIEPTVPHRVALQPGASFKVEFHRRAD